MWGSLTNNAVRIVAIALSTIALLGFYLGVRGAMPAGRSSDDDAPAATTTGPVQEVQPIQEVMPPPPVPETKAEDANATNSAADKDEDEDEEVTPLPPPKTVRPPPANVIEAPDPIGNLIAQPPVEEAPEPVPF